jgi:hypothetical protein
MGSANDPPSQALPVPKGGVNQSLDTAGATR